MIVKLKGACMASLPTIRRLDFVNAGRIDLRRLHQFAPLPLRLIVGYGFIAHGLAKLSRGPDTFAVVLHTLGVPLPFPLAWLTTLVELIGGFCIVVGAFV